ncbi:MAG: microcin ABC transporter permease, partial [Magnetococcales bacterium]|nr:microcin ABC transporter permease [Magnetococcales bacterium]
MWTYVLHRLLLMLPTLFGIMAVSFMVIQFVPGGPVERMISMVEQKHSGGGHETATSSSGSGGYRGGRGLDQAQIDALKKLYGFDKPAHERFMLMLGNYVRFEFGDSYYHHRSVVDLVVDKLPVSISL